MPSQNEGIEIPSKDNDMIVLLTGFLGLAPANTPKGIAATPAKHIAITVISKVAGILSKIKSSAGLLNTKDLPRFP